MSAPADLSAAGGSDARGGRRAGAGRPLLEARGVSKRFGGVAALEDASFEVRAGAITCLLGDNGAGKSTLVALLSGVHAPTAGELLRDGQPVSFASPRDARRRGVETVYQDLALVPLMSVWRNFFLGSEPTVGWGPLRRLDASRCRELAREALERTGIRVGDPDRAVATLSGGERQSLAIARALHHGADVLILDEPTAALGVRQTRTVLRAMESAREQGAGVVFVTHNPRHAHPVGDRFVVLRRGRVVADATREAMPLERLTELMAGGPA
ncbi:MAG: ATP-binding cassette domain-containing protein [Gemmatimonadetes bacterium]|nr:ATP-binding cassette domain-containing protein [Gemmatimonadota bacterium]